MTLPLPDPRVDQKPWEEERAGVQRNLDALAMAFPIQPKDTATAVVLAGAITERIRIYGPYTANSGSMASGAEATNITVTHNENIAGTQIVAGHLTDGSWSAHVGWRVASAGANSFAITFRNNGPNTATAILNCVVISIV